MQQEKLTPWRRFIRLLLIEKEDIIQIFNYAVFSGLLSLSLPLGIQAIINLIQGAQISTSWFVLVTLVTLGVIFTGVLQFMQLRIIETIQQRIFVKASFELSFRFPKIKTEALRNNYPPELANRFFDTLTIQKSLSKVLIDVPAALLQVLFALILLSFYHPLFIVFGTVLLALVVLVFQPSVKKGLKTSLKESKYKYRVAHWIQEIARSMTSFKLSGRTQLALTKNDVLVTEYLKAREQHFGVIKSQFIKMIGFKAIITAGLLLIGGMLVLNQTLNIGQFVAAEIIILMVISAVEKLIVSLQTFYDMLTAIEKLGQVVDKPLEDLTGNQCKVNQDLKVELDQVSLHVPNRTKSILNQVSLNIDPNSRIIVQGESGSGKSSLLQIIAGVIKPTGGNMYVNHHSIFGLNLNQYRSLLGLSLNNEYPFEGTLRENLTFSDASISDERIFEVLEVLGMLNFMKDLPKSLDTVLYPEGKQISYSVSKKIVLARAILKQPKLMILEDALDQFNETETRTIIEYLCRADQPWALVVVSKNDYWKPYCTNLIRLEDGIISNQ